MTTDSDISRWQKPVAPGGPSRLDILRLRHRARRAARATLDAEDFVQIDAPLLVHGTTPDPAVASWAVGDRYLVTSTEYQLKRLAAGGLPRLYTLTQNVRPGDAGAFRNPEFTMLEWGRVGEDMDAIERDAEAIVTAAMQALGLGDHLTWQGRTLDMRRPWRRQSVADAVQEHTGVTLDTFDAATCARAAEAAGLTLREDWRDHRDFLFSLLMDAIQPKLGADRPVFLCDWPMFQTTSAAPAEGGVTACRSELFIAGVELADGFAGVADVDMQQQLFAMAEEARRAAGMDPVARDERYLRAMEESAIAGAGMAMGFDRLVMLLTDQPTIATVLAFGWDEV